MLNISTNPKCPPYDPVERVFAGSGIANLAYSWCRSQIGTIMIYLLNDKIYVVTVILTSNYYFDLAIN